jgi:hypothetical protein
MDRRIFIQALSAFVAVATVAPDTLTIQPVDWLEWNELSLRCLSTGATSPTVWRRGRS